MPYDAKPFLEQLINKLTNDIENLEGQIEMSAANAAVFSQLVEVQKKYIATRELTVKALQSLEALEN